MDEDTSKDIRVEICLGSEFNDRGRKPKEEVYLVRRLYEAISVDPKSFGLQLTKKQVVLPNGKTSGMIYETTYKGILVLGDSKEDEYKRFGLLARVQDCPHQYGHEVFLKESLDIGLLSEQGGGKIQLVDALLSPVDMYHDCAIIVPDKEAFLKALLGRGHDQGGLSRLRSIVNVNDKSLEVDEATRIVGNYLEHLFYSSCRVLV